jgi:hypothetical protein
MWWWPVYDVVLDCKYTGAIKSQYWSGTEKYLEIRNTITQRQVVKQLWLIAPATNGNIRSEDSAITLTDNGPSCRPDETVRFVLSVSPGEADGNDPFYDFAEGIIIYLRRHFGSAPAEKEPG